MTEQIKDEVTKSENEVVGELHIIQYSDHTQNIDTSGATVLMLLNCIDNIIELIADSQGNGYEETFQALVLELAEGNDCELPTSDDFIDEGSVDSTELGD